jgi:Lon protease-like protein
LHIFEPRYRAMVADALAGDRIIGMVLLRPGFEATYEGRPSIHPIGGAGVITQVERLQDGRFNIELRGLVKFRVTGEDQSQPYRLAHVEAIPESSTDEDKMALRKQQERLKALVTAAIGGEPNVPPGISDEDFVNMTAQYIDLEPSERQRLLERPSVLARAQALIELLEKRR